jgi:hypothetical protein
MKTKTTNRRISEATINKLKRVADEEHPTEVLFPDEAKEILGELRYLSLQLLGEFCGSLIKDHLTKESVVCRAVRLGTEKHYKLLMESRDEDKRRT